jgi:hypothetical protein
MLLKPAGPRRIGVVELVNGGRHRCLPVVGEPGGGPRG